jgi:prepilin-type N-terminal cleavage/methylation domain-containing protein
MKPAGQDMKRTWPFFSLAMLLALWRDRRELASRYGSEHLHLRTPRSGVYNRLKPMRHGFTLVEMLVVLLVMILALGALMPGTSMLQKQSDLYSTANVLSVVHGAQQRCARQFGSAGMIYGYTIIFSSDTFDASGALQYKTSTNVVPWIVVGDTSASYKTNASPGYDLQSDIGKQQIWDTGSSPPNTIIFPEKSRRPARSVTIGTSDSGSLPTGGGAARRYLHVALMPRTGLMYAKLTDNVNPTAKGVVCAPAGAPGFTVSELTKPTATWMDVMGSLRIEMWDIKYIKGKWTATNQRGHCYVSETGAFEARGTE